MPDAKPTGRALRHDGWTPRRRTLFLKTLAETANVRAAAVSAGKSACGVYALRRRDADFARAWDDALSLAMDELEAIAFDRIRNGVQKTVVRAGGVTVTITEYSDRLLMFMLSRRRPEAYAALVAADDDDDEELEIYRTVEARVTQIETRRAGRDA
ncbi:hypothetical protein [Sphingosinicella soli]|uniref:Terminase small subunit n=1 Tax=Sphingosinicella soli TaxID=333708 RepID=A0A7W7AZN8_9SPHN|nr:hypothetical protein [Sphingosinicella soli]MBB4631316.1 hypothetical protein [Sphingosinicella soli]